MSQCHFLLKESYETKPGSIQLSDLGHLSCVQSSQRETIQSILDSIGLGSLFPGQPQKRFEKSIYFANGTNSVEVFYSILLVLHL